MPTNPQSNGPDRSEKGSDEEKRVAWNDLDAAVLRALLMLSDGHPSDFIDLDWPPEEVIDWIRHANVREVKGLLLSTLERWYEVHGLDRPHD